MRKFLLAFVALLFISFLFAKTTFAQDSSEEYYRARVLEVTETQDLAYTHEVTLEFLEGPMAGETVTVNYGGFFAAQENQDLREGETVVAVKTQGPEGETFFIADKYRIPALLLIFALFLVAVVIFSGLKGLSRRLGRRVIVPVPALLQWLGSSMNA